jgi:LysM repeat protein
MAARSPLRLLAPIALVVVLVGVVMVIASSGGDGGGGGGSGSKTSARTTTTAAKPVPGRRTYVVKQGDTLTAISDKTGIPAERILALNPGLDPPTLQPGDRIKIRP